jgi:hypothetical protein
LVLIGESVLSHCSSIGEFDLIGLIAHALQSSICSSQGEQQKESCPKHDQKAL